MSHGPKPGSRDTYAPAVGLRVPFSFSSVNCPLRPFNVMFLTPVPFLTWNISDLSEPITAFRYNSAALIPL